MICKVIAIALIPLLLHCSVIAQTSQALPQASGNIQQVLRHAQENDKTVNVKLLEKIDRQNKLVGKVSEISDTAFTLIDQKTGMVTKLNYDNVQQVKQKGMSVGWKIALVSVAGFVIVVIIATRPWRSE